MCYGCSATFNLLNHPTICTVCIESGGRSTCMPGNPIPQSLYSNAYYHPHIACIQSVWTQFSPPPPPLRAHSYLITQDACVRGSLQQEHKEAISVWLLPPLDFTGICLRLQYLYPTVRLVTIECVLLTNYSCSIILIIYSADH